MLVLSRGLSESVSFKTSDGTRIEVMVVRIGADQVRLGIEAPRSVEILRAELEEKAA